MLAQSYKLVTAALTGCAMLGLASAPALAYSCESEYNKAEELIKQAKMLVTADTDSRVLGMIQEAEGIADAGIISHRKAGQRHGHVVGKFKHSDAVRKGRWAQALAKQALFLLDGKAR